MRRLLLKVSAVLGASALLLLPLAGTCLAAGKTVLVLPFAVDSGVKMPDAAKKIPQDIVDKLKAQGLEPVPMDKARGLFNASISFGGTSLIIVVSVVLETIKQVESMMLVRNYRGFLND